MREGHRTDGAVGWRYCKAQILMLLLGFILLLGPFTALREGRPQDRWCCGMRMFMLLSGFILLLGLFAAVGVVNFVVCTL